MWPGNGEYYQYEKENSQSFVHVGVSFMRLCDVGVSCVFDYA